MRPPRLRVPGPRHFAQPVPDRLAEADPALRGRRAHPLLRDSVSSFGLVPVSVLRDVPVVLATTLGEHAAGAAVYACELEVDEGRAPVGADEDVVLLVQVVVANAPAMHGGDQRGEQVEVVGWQLGRSPERSAGEEGAGHGARHGARHGA